MEYKNMFNLINQLIVVAIEHGGDLNGPCFSCGIKLKGKMYELLTSEAEIYNSYTITNIYFSKFGRSIPQFIKRETEIWKN